MYNECRHIMPSGSKCHSPALTGKPYCYYHANLHRSSGTAGRPTAKLPVPQIEDARGIQLTLQQVLSAVESPFIHPRAIGHTLYGLQLAIQLLNRIEAPAPAEVIRTLCDTEGEPIHQPDQDRQEQKDQTIQKDPTDPSDPVPDALAPVKTVCEPPHDCLNCIHQETCDNYQEPDDNPTFEAEEDEEEEEDEEDAETEDEDDEDRRDIDDQDEEDDDPDVEEEESDDQDDENDSDPEDAESPEEQQLITAALRILQKESPSRNRKTSHRKPPPDPLAA